MPPGASGRRRVDRSVGSGGSTAPRRRPREIRGVFDTTTAGQTGAMSDRDDLPELDEERMVETDDDDELSVDVVDPEYERDDLGGA